MRKLQLLVLMVFSVFLLGNTTVTLTPDYCSIPEYERSATDGNDYTLCDTSSGEDIDPPDDTTLPDDTSSGEEPDSSEDTSSSDLPSYCDLPEGERSATDGNDYTVCDSVEDPPSYIDTRDYKKIYKKDGIWYGVIDIEKRNIFAVEEGELPGVIVQVGKTQHYALEFAFTRDTKYLKSIDISFTRAAYCPVAMDFLCRWFGGTVEEYNSGVITYEYDDSSVPLGEAKSIEEAFGDGTITLSADPEFDYVINLEHTTTNEEPVHIELNILQFTYVLTDLEVDDVNDDIQAQYDLEVQAILHDDSLNITTKQLALDQLNIEYDEYNITYNEEITSLCLNDELCSVEAFEENEENVEEVPSWVQDIIDKILKGSAIIIAAVGGISIVGVIAYMFVRKALETTGTVAWITTKGTVYSGAWIGKRIALGILEILKPIGVGFKALGKWNLLIAAVFIVIVIVIL